MFVLQAMVRFGVGACSAVLMGTAQAAVIFDYTGNPFDQGNVPGSMGQHLTASVTFGDAVSGFTGIADGSFVSAWSIRVAGLPNTELHNLNAISADWPLWFRFVNGTIEDWQLLGRPSFPNPSVVELYTTRNSPFSRINPTFDFYELSNTTSVFTENNPGVWQRRTPAGVPEPTAASLAALGLIGMAASVRRRVRGKPM